MFRHHFKRNDIYWEAGRGFFSFCIVRNIDQYCKHIRFYATYPIYIGTTQNW